MKALIYTRCHAGLVSSYLAGENLRHSAKAMGWDVRTEIHSQLCTTGPFTEEDIAEAELVVVAAVAGSDLSRFDGKKLFRADIDTAIQHPQRCLQEAQAQAKIYHVTDETVANKIEQIVVEPPSTGHNGKPLNVIAVTACPTGVAHTYMAAEALERAAKQLGYNMHVEKRGSIGAKDALSPEQIALADLVILAADIEVNTTPFAGKRIYRTTTGKALKQPQMVLSEATVSARPEVSVKPEVEDRQHSSTVVSESPGVYKHLMTGVSYMLPMVVAGGLSVALSFMLGIEAFKEAGTLAAALMKIGSDSAFALMIPLLSGYIACSIADRPGLTPGLVGGMLASSLGAGFLGGIVSGFFAGYTARAMMQKIQLPKTMEALKPILIVPLFSTLITGLMMIFITGGPVAGIMKGLENFLVTMGDANAVLLGLLLGAMMCFDLGGPVNKAAYAFGVGLLASKHYEPMAAVMAAGMTPAIAMGIVTWLGRRHFSADEREAGKASFVLGLCFISEGAIPFAARDPLRVIPSMMVGGAIAGALSMYFDITLMAPHGGLLVLFIPHAISAPLLYAGIIAIGSMISALIYLILMRIVSLKGPEAVSV